MIKFSDLKIGDYVLAESDGQAWQGEVSGFNNDEKEVNIYNGVQDFYFKTDDLYPIPLDENQLMKLKFHKDINDDGSVKYSKGPFVFNALRKIILPILKYGIGMKKNYASPHFYTRIAKPLPFDDESSSDR